MTIVVNINRKGKDFSEVLKMSRKEKKMTQTELANKVGISAMSISRYESGESIPDIGILGSLCVALNDDDLFDSWHHSWRRYNIAEGNRTTKSIQEQKEEFRTIKAIAARRYLSNLINEGSPLFLDYMDEIVKKLQNMNIAGIKQVRAMVDIISKVPEYRSNGSWTLKDNQQKETKDNAENKDKSNVGNVSSGEAIKAEGE